MTYQELLQQLANQAVAQYSQYLQSKIDAQTNVGGELIPEKTQYFKDAAEEQESKFNAVLATVKSGQNLNEPVSDEDMSEFMK